MPLLLSLLSGILTTLALPPVGWWPLGLVGIAVLAGLSEKNTHETVLSNSIQPNSTQQNTVTPAQAGVQLLGKKTNWIPAFAGMTSFKIGWCWGMGYFTASLYWISWALTHDIARYGWLIPLAVLGLPAVLSIYTGLATLALHHLQKRNIAGPAVFTLLLFASEWLRGHLFTGFPWNLFGMFWLGTPLAQMASIIGLYGLTLITILTASMLACAVKPSNHRLQLPIMAALLIAWGGMWMWCEDRLNTNNLSPVQNQPTYLRIVQPNTSPREKWDPENRQDIFQHLLRLSEQPFSSDVAEENTKPHIIIWPETTFNSQLAASVANRILAARGVQPNGYLLAGSIRRDGQGRAYNSLVAITPKGDVAGYYDKHHLVPFGEYVPLRNVQAIATLASGVGEFSPGPGAVTWQLPDIPAFSPLICYEVIFPGRAIVPGTAEKQPRPQFLLNITNDSWYEKTAGPHQHLAQAQMRAIETGLPLIRAAGTGISAVVNAYGQIEQQVPLKTAGVINTTIPPSLSSTLYSHWGEWPLILGLMVLLLIIALQNMYARKTPRLPET